MRRGEVGQLASRDVRLVRLGREAFQGDTVISVTLVKHYLLNDKFCFITTHIHKSKQLSLKPFALLSFWREIHSGALQLKPLTFRGGSERTSASSTRYSTGHKCNVKVVAS